MKPNIQLPKNVRNAGWPAQEGNERQLQVDGEGREGRTKKTKSLKALYGILPMNGNETALHYATRKPKKGKKKMPFIISKSTSEPLGQLPSHLLAISLGHTHTHIHKKKK